MYYVQFDNDPEYGNSEDPDRLEVWYGHNITAYAAGSNADGGSFDIGTVELLTPSDEATVSLPTTFVWAGRGTASDRYSVGFASLDGEEVCFSTLSEQTSLVVDEAFRVDCKLSLDTPYEWYVYVADGDYGNGYGSSYARRLVTLTGGQAPPP
jgi:hypothetical protein